MSRERLSPAQWARLKAELRKGVALVGGRVSVAGVVCYRPGDRPRLFYQVRVCRRHKGKPKGSTWADYRDLIIATHQHLGTPLI